MKRKIKISNDGYLNLGTYVNTVRHYFKICKIAVLDMPKEKLRQFVGVFLLDLAKIFPLRDPLALKINLVDPPRS